MDRFRDLLVELMAGESQSAFERRTGIDQSELSKVLKGHRPPGPMAIVRLAAVFRDRRDDIFDLGLAAMKEAEGAAGARTGDTSSALYTTGVQDCISLSA